MQVSSGVWLAGDARGDGKLGDSASSSSVDKVKNSTGREWINHFCPFHRFAEATCGN